MRFATTSLLLITLLFLGLGCHDKVEVQPPPVINLANCRIVKETYKTIYISGPKSGYEQLTVAGKKFDVYDWERPEYVYDVKGRIARKVQPGFRASSNSLYTYSPANLFIASTVTNDGVTSPVRIDTIPLNARGYDDRYQYDDQGHALFYKTSSNKEPTRWENNNKTHYTANWGEGKVFYVSEFDLTRKALPTIFAYQGVESKNLITSLTISASGVGFIKDGPVFRINYTYEFDAYGRVKRRIEHDTKYPDTGWPFGTNPGFIGVYDYEYECP